MLALERKRDKLGGVCHAFGAMSEPSVSPTTLTIDFTADGIAWCGRAELRDSGEIRVVFFKECFEEAVMPPPVALVLLQWASFAVQRLQGRRAGAVVDLIKEGASLSLLAIHSEH